MLAGLKRQWSLRILKRTYIEMLHRSALSSSQKLSAKKIIGSTNSRENIQSRNTSQLRGEATRSHKQARRPLDTSPKSKTNWTTQIHRWFLTYKFGSITSVSRANGSTMPAITWNARRQPSHSLNASIARTITTIATAGSSSQLRSSIILGPYGPLHSTNLLWRYLKAWMLSIWAKCQMVR